MHCSPDCHQKIISISVPHHALPFVTLLGWAGTATLCEPLVFKQLCSLYRALAQRLLVHLCHEAPGLMCCCPRSSDAFHYQGADFNAEAPGGVPTSKALPRSPEMVPTTEYAVDTALWFTSRVNSRVLYGSVTSRVNR